MNEGEEMWMAGGAHSMAAEFVGGPADGTTGVVGTGLERVPVTIPQTGEVHMYEFDPVTTVEGRWVFRHAGLGVQHLLQDGEEGPQG